jgi:hypothetical protein
MDHPVQTMALHSAKVMIAVAVAALASAAAQDAGKGGSSAARAPEQQGRAGEAAATDSTSPEQERLTHERAYQQQLAKRRAQEAEARVRFENDAAISQNPQAFYDLLIDTAEHLAAKHEYQAAIRMFNRAMEAKPAGVPLTDRIKQLKATLAGQNTPVEVAITSDGVTWVSIAGYRQPEKFAERSLKMLPGNYEVVGRRKGFQDVVIPVQVRTGAPAPKVAVVCTIPVE